MRSELRTVSFLALFVATAMAAPARAEGLRGVALLIGQADYHSLTGLENPINDARAMDELLSNLGFDVTRVLDRGGDRLRREIDDFIDDATGADVALVYYAGHAVEVAGHNYLVPIDADLASPAATGHALVSVGALLDELVRTVPVTIVLLDACRTEVFPSGSAVVLPGASEVVPVGASGLTDMRGPTPVFAGSRTPESVGVVIGFAAGPGEAALDGPPGGNSPYAAALLKHLSAGGYNLSDLLTLVTQEVYLETEGRQIPWTNSSLRGFLTFGKPDTGSNNDDVQIVDARRELLMNLARVPTSTRTVLEEVAASQEVPLDALFGMLGVIGVDVANATSIEEMLVRGAEELKALKALETGTAKSDPELIRLSDLANRAQEEGAIALALEFRAQASERARAIEANLDTIERGLESDRREIAATFVEHAITARLNFRFREAANLYGEAASQMDRWDPVTAFEYRDAQAFSLFDAGFYQGDVDAAEESAMLYERLSIEFPKDDIDEWALRRAIAGEAYFGLAAARSDFAALQRAEDILRDVIGIVSPTDNPRRWSGSWQSLGDVLDLRAQWTGRIEHHHDSISAYQTALETAEPDTPRYSRILVQIASGQMQVGARTGDVSLIEQALATLNDAAAYLPLGDDPFDWTYLHTLRAVALLTLGNVTRDIARVEEASSVYELALSELAIEEMPVQWLTAMGGLAVSLLSTYELSGNVDALIRADATYQQIFELMANDGHDWALNKSNHARVLKHLAEATGRRDTLEDARLAALAALHYYESSDLEPTSRYNRVLEEIESMLASPVID